MIREITITKAENGYVITKAWGPPEGGSVAVAESPMELAEAVHRFFYDAEYVDAYILEKVPERLRYKVREFIRDNKE